MSEDPTKDWFVANIRELRWQENELGATCDLDKHRERFEEFGINLTVLRPRQPMTMYHREHYQEGFLVLRGECLLIVEAREVPLASGTTSIAQQMWPTLSSARAMGCRSCSPWAVVSART
jgi:hypothetical protein